VNRKAPAKRKPRVAAKKAATPKTEVPSTVLVLRTCDANMKSHRGFVWPKSGPVSCSDWSKEPVCGQGLHGFLWGEGDGSLANHDPSANWLVVEVVASEIVNLQGKVKFPRGTVVFCGSAFDATKYIAERAPNVVRAIVRGTSTSGDRGEIRIRWWDEKTTRYRTAIGYTGEEGLLAGVAYCCRDGKFYRRDGK
jgi:hypothetical protein